MMRTLILIHRWLGIAFCLLFVMWFATGIVMHFVPFPALTEAERVAGLPLIAPSSRIDSPQAVLTASNLAAAARVRLVARSDGLIYIVEGARRLSAFHATDLSSAAVQTESLALELAVLHARERGIDAAGAKAVERADHDQWTVPNGLDAHRPLYRVALNDAAGTELYVSSVSGEIVRDTTRHERRWNYAGSVLHWIYPTLLRKHWSAWDVTVWTLSLFALIAASTGAVLGVTRTEIKGGRVRSPFSGWQAWHHWLGLACMTFVLTWIFSGWLSMDHGRLFSTGKLTTEESSAFEYSANWREAPLPELNSMRAGVREIEWFPFDGRLYRRDRRDASTQVLIGAVKATAAPRIYLSAEDVTRIGERLGRSCLPAVAVEATDDYALTSSTPGAPVYRVICGETWFHVDGANGAPLEKLDSSRRAYRWLYQGLHTFDFPALMKRETLRTALIVILCALGACFSVTAVVIGWRRAVN
ncbi:MAG: Optional hypothetical component of the transporter BtuN [Betaproteobacteria bacterium]|nr:Optional hypothetical component of the transporter BtuN [Betaproteobacteria bacterium]